MLEFLQISSQKEKNYYATEEQRSLENVQKMQVTADIHSLNESIASLDINGNLLTPIQATHAANISLPIPDHSAIQSPHAANISLPIPKLADHDLNEFLLDAANNNLLPMTELSNLNKRKSMPPQLSPTIELEQVIPPLGIQKRKRKRRRLIINENLYYEPSMHIKDIIATMRCIDPADDIIITEDLYSYMDKKLYVTSMMSQLNNSRRVECQPMSDNLTILFDRTVKQSVPQEPTYDLANLQRLLGIVETETEKENEGNTIDQPRATVDNNLTETHGQIDVEMVNEQPKNISNQIEMMIVDEQPQLAIQPCYKYNI